MARSALLNVMVQAAMKAGRSLVRDFGEVQNLQVSLKGPGDYVSQADRRAEEIVHAELSRVRPGYGFLMEERGEIEGVDKTHRWIVDPLDGTMNFLHGIPHWSVSIALEMDGELIAGVIYDPIKDEMFWAEKGLGAYMNNRRITVAGRQLLTDTAVSIQTQSHSSVEGMQELLQSGMLVRSMGSTCLDLCYVASGRLDAMYKANISGGLWDVAAGVVLVREARGVVTDRSHGKNFANGGSIVAANSPLHAELMKRVKPATKPQKASTAS
jgi:myo-inositol-1(or 4)-monophosphatase